MSRLFIAEKPSVGKAIAAELGVTTRGDGFIQCGGDVVTWCFGHMLEQAEPDEYTPEDAPKNGNGKKVWRVEDLPIIPENWIVRVKDDAKKQVKLIGQLLKDASLVVNAGDPDREGQLLVDDVLEHFNNKKPVMRYWSSGADEVSVKRALAGLSENARYAGWGDAARARARADWLIGMNFSRAYTLSAKRGGSLTTLTVGRVQTPTLAIVVARDREIEAFRAITYFTLRAQFSHQGESFLASWVPSEDQAGLDTEGRLVDESVANGLTMSLSGKPGQIIEYIQEAKKKAHPLSFSLSDITAIASSRWGYSAEDVLKVCQALYETHKITTYPRTDCSYLIEAQHNDAPQVLAAVRQFNPHLAAVIDRADPSIKSRTWNDKKITAHHGIIPTMQKGNLAALSEQERNIYDVIVLGYLAQFYPVHEYLQTDITVEIERESFKTTGRVVTKNGWKDVFSDPEEEAGDGEDDESQGLPAMKQGDSVTCAQVQKREAKTKAPPRFNEGSLGRAMENIHRFVTDPEHKKLLRDGDGIGTSATRASIIGELKRRKFLEPKGKNIISTTLGRSLVDALPESVKSPVLTALYERMLKGIEEGTASLDAFISKQETYVRDQVAKANTGSVSIAGGKEAATASSIHKCMACGHPLARRPSSKKRGFYWWGCTNYPTCKQTYFDLKGRPDYSKGREQAATTGKE